MEYLDVDLEIGTGLGRDYPVVARSQVGEARLTMHFPSDAVILESRLKDLRIALLQSLQPLRKALTEEERAVQDFGRTLFEALLAGDARTLYDVSRDRAAQEGRPGVWLRLRIQAPELAALPWEYLFDPRQDDYLCLSRSTPLVRYPELAHPIQPLLITLPLRILGMIASPSDLDPLEVEREQGRMHQALARLEAEGWVQLTWLAGQTWEELQEAMWAGPWHVFHFIGHGGFDQRAEEGMLALANEQGKAHLLSATHLARLLTNHRTLRLVILNACEGGKGSSHDLFSSTAATLARRGIPAVLAMQEQITDRTSIQLTRTFYRALSKGLPVEAAVAEARTAISLSASRTLEWGTPILYLRSTDGLLFDLAERTPSAQQHVEEQPVQGNRPVEASATTPSSGGTDQGTIVRMGTREPAKGETAPPGPKNSDLTIIELGIEAARKLGADHHPVSLTELHAVYLRDYPSIDKGKTFDSFSATMSYHTINMRARFPDPAHKQKLTLWLTRPVFKRVGYGQYMLLSAGEQELFHRLVEAGDSHIYEDEYHLEDLAQPTQQVSITVPAILTTNDDELTQAQMDQPMRKARPGRQWTEESLFNRLQELCSPEGVQAARQFYHFAQQRGARLRWGVGKTFPAVTAAFLIRGVEVSVFTLSEWPADMGGLSVNFDDFVSKGLPSPVISQLADTLQTIPGVKEEYAGLEAAQFKKRRSLSLDQIFTQRGAVEAAIGAFEALLRS